MYIIANSKVAKTSESPIWANLRMTEMTIEDKGSSAKDNRLSRTVVIPVHTIMVNPRVEIDKNGTTFSRIRFMRLSFFGCVTTHISFIVSCNTPNAPIAPVRVKTTVVNDANAEVNGVLTDSRS